MRSKRQGSIFRYLLPLVASAFITASLLVACGGTPGDNAVVKGQTDFTNDEPNGSDPNSRGYNDAPGLAGGAADSSNSAKQAPGAPPNGRTGTVEEADIYRIDNNRLFYLNTYRGFVVYDLNDARNPKRVSRLPVYGYPIEMFIKGNTVYALLKDALYLTQDKGRLKFERHNVSQLVTIDVSDLRHPKVLQTVDIIGQLREGVSRKIEDTIYVVSYVPQNYYWGWYYGRPQTDQQKEQAHVYSFNVADAKNPRLVDKLKIFEGGSIQLRDKNTGSSYTRRFNGVSISATSNALMVVENWRTYGYTSRSGTGTCSSYRNTQEATVSIVDISDPKGSIKVHTKFHTKGHLTDQFKMTYVYDKAANTGTFYGIFARREWSGSGCQWRSNIQNTFESWDVSDGKNPKQLDELNFGKKDETVRGSTFDPERKVAFAITARQIDPLYVISFADRKNIKILSEIDGLSGDMNVFRFIDGKKFLMGIGRDNTKACTGFQGTETQRATNVAVSIIDVRNLNAIRLVQRQCVAINNASWVGSAINWNLDQAHKMIGMFSDGRVNAITVPVYYYKKHEDTPGWWWYRYETAIGLMTYDTARFDPTKDETKQTVLQNFGTIVHPHGQVRRSIVFTHKGSNRRMVVNLSDTHISIADIENMAQPKYLASVELAPYITQLYRYGKYIVEQVQNGRWGYQAKSEFRVKVAGSNLEDAKVVAKFAVGQVRQVVKHGDKLVLFRYVYDNTKNTPYYYNGYTEALIYDLSNPASPQKRGTVKVPGSTYPYYYYWCGGWGYWGGYWFGNQRNWTTTTNGIVFLSHNYDYQTRTSKRQLMFLDMTNAGKPTLSTYTLSSATTWTFFGLVPDPMDKGSFYLTYRTNIGKTTINGTTFYRYRYYAQRWANSGSKWSGVESINLPGRLIRTWAKNGSRMFLTHDYTYKTYTQNGRTYWQPDFRLNLLRELSVLGRPVAQLLDWHNFVDTQLKDLVVDGDKLFINSRRSYSYAQKNNLSYYDLSDHLTIFDLSNNLLSKAFSEPTGTYQVRLMGTYKGKLFLNLPGDGVLLVDVSDPKAPTGVRFVRTLGWATHIEFANNRAFIASGYFGIYELPLSGPTVLPTTPPSS